MIAYFQPDDPRNRPAPTSWEWEFASVCVSKQSNGQGNVLNLALPLNSNAQTVWSVSAPVWLLAAVFLLLPILVWMLRWLQLRSRLQRGHCWLCRYDLRGTPGDRCTECGVLREKASRRASIRYQLGRLVRSVLLAALISFCVFSCAFAIVGVWRESDARIIIRPADRTPEGVNTWEWSFTGPVPAWRINTESGRLFVSHFYPDRGGGLLVVATPNTNWQIAGARDEERTGFLQPGGRTIFWGHMRTVSLPIWLLNTVFFSPLLILWLRRFFRHKRGLCLACGYDLRGSPGERCPECGLQRSITKNPA